MRWKTEFGADKYGNPAWNISYPRAILIGVIVGAIFGAAILVAES